MMRKNHPERTIIAGLLVGFLGFLPLTSTYAVDGNENSNDNRQEVVTNNSNTGIGGVISESDISEEDKKDMEAYQKEVENKDKAEIAKTTERDTTDPDKLPVETELNNAYQLLVINPKVKPAGNLIVSEQGDVYILKYNTEKDAQDAYIYYQNGNSDAVSPDQKFAVADDDYEKNPNTETKTDEDVLGELDKAEKAAEKDKDKEITINDDTKDNNDNKEVKPSATPTASATADTDKNNKDSKKDNDNKENKKYLIAELDTGVSDDCKVEERVSMLGDDGKDINGHGTKMYKYIMNGLDTNNTDIISIKVADDNGHANLSNIYAGIKYAYERGADVINLSMSSYAGYRSRVLESVITDARKAGAIVVVSAGNDGKNVRDYIPANFVDATVAGSCGADGKIADFSNYGATIDYLVVSDSTSEAAAKLTNIIASNNGVLKESDYVSKLESYMSVFSKTNKQLVFPNTYEITDEDKKELDVSDRTDSDFNVNYNYRADGVPLTDMSLHSKGIVNGATDTAAYGSTKYVTWQQAQIPAGGIHQNADGTVNFTVWISDGFYTNPSGAVEYWTDELKFTIDDSGVVQTSPHVIAVRQASTTGSTCGWGHHVLTWNNVGPGWHTIHETTVRGEGSVGGVRQSYTVYVPNMYTCTVNVYRQNINGGWNLDYTHSSRVREGSNGETWGGTASNNIFWASATSKTTHNNGNGASLGTHKVYRNETHTFYIPRKQYALDVNSRLDGYDSGTGIWEGKRFADFDITINGNTQRNLADYYGNIYAGSTVTITPHDYQQGNNLSEYLACVEGSLNYSGNAIGDGTSGWHDNRYNVRLAYRTFATINVSKVWLDEYQGQGSSKYTGDRPTSIPVTLRGYIGNNKVYDSTQYITNGNGYSVTFSNVALGTQDAGSYIRYYIYEDNIKQKYSPNTGTYYNMSGEEIIYTSDSVNGKRVGYDTCWATQQAFAISLKNSYVDKNPGLSIVKRVEDKLGNELNMKFVEYKDDLHYFVTVTNPSKYGYYFTVTDTIPNDLVYQSSTHGDWGFSRNGQTLTWNRVPISAGGSVTFEIVAKANSNNQKYINHAEAYNNHFGKNRTNVVSNYVTNYSGHITLDKTIENYYKPYGRPVFLYEITDTKGKKWHKMLLPQEKAGGTDETTWNIPTGQDKTETYQIYEFLNSRYHFRRSAIASEPVNTGK